MKFSPLPATGITIAVVALSVGAVALSRKLTNSESVKQKSPKTDVRKLTFSKDEWEKFKTSWPSNESNDETVEEDVPVTEESSHIVEDELAGYKTWPEKTVGEAKSDVETSIKKALEPVENNPADLADAPEDRVIIGDGEGEVKPFGKSYAKIINNAYKQAKENKDFTLELYGKTHGLGARGTKLEGLDINGVRYNASDIAKLYHKINATSSK